MQKFNFRRRCLKGPFLRSGHIYIPIERTTRLARSRSPITESSEEESDESDVEWESGPPTTPEQPSLQDSLVEEELETNQPLVVNTVPVLDIQPNRDNLEREKVFLSNGF